MGVWQRRLQGTLEVPDEVTDWGIPLGAPTRAVRLWWKGSGGAWSGGLVSVVPGSASGGAWCVRFS